MTHYSVELSKSAELDLRETMHYISENLKAPAAAKRLLDEIERAVKNLEENPARCALARDKRLADSGHRWIKAKNYLVFFVIDENSKTVMVSRILYGRRNWAHLL
ncbi:MAG: type II toxin-antitoxin system RelE/ParE family toxin [Coriobacteriales bacterium]|jgi:toxin ParE1/3/4|nr:type II toxin-antitoxin system RelE/ParE family toxin [Coriobacteriales bacterium]